MKLIYLTITTCIAWMTISCEGQRPRQSNEVVNGERPMARISIPECVDMGTFPSDVAEKNVTLELRNVGDDTLFVYSILPDCNCVTVSIKDSILPPYDATTVQASLNLESYFKGDTIAKQFVITSNSVDERHKRVTLIGILE